MSGANGRFRYFRSVEVRFRDIDEMGHAHHTLPLIYIEEARTSYWREVLGRSELDFIMGEAGVRFHQRIMYPSTVSVAVRTTRLGALREARERAVHLGDREEQRHTDERDQEIHGKPVEHFARRHPGKPYPNEQRERERQHADVDCGRAAQRDGQDERRDGDPREAHRGAPLA